MLLLVSAGAGAQESRVLRGTVVDPTGVALSYANVQLNGGRRSLADDSGRFQVPITVRGELRLLVRRIGFEPTELRLVDVPDTSVRIEMRPVPLQLRTVTVEAGLSPYRSLDTQGFYRRMRESERGFTRGHFITPEDIEFRNPVRLTQLAEGLPSVRVQHNLLNPLRDAIVGSDGCRMTVYLDRVRIVGRLSGRDDFVNELVATTHIAAMEIYSRPLAAPPEYQALNGTCGVVLIWTK